MKREIRYIVAKIKDADKYLSADQLAHLKALIEVIDDGRIHDEKPALECAVVESDWPEYEPTWKAIEDRVNTQSIVDKLKNEIFDYQQKTGNPPAYINISRQDYRLLQVQSQLENFLFSSPVDAMPMKFMGIDLRVSDSQPVDRRDIKIQQLARKYQRSSEIIHNMIVANQAAWLEWKQGRGADYGMKWIENGLMGPGQIPQTELSPQLFFDSNQIEVSGMDYVLHGDDHQAVNNEG